jgi:type VI secretion system secreted protein Hcp
MAADIFLEIDGVKGESKDQKFKEMLEIDSYSWGVANTGTSARGGGMGSGKANFQDFHFTKQIDMASPELMKLCATGKHIAKAVLHCRKAGGKQEEYLTVTFNDLLISSYQLGGAGEAPSEQISFNFTKVKQEYKEQTEKGATGKSHFAEYDLKQQQAA